MAGERTLKVTILGDADKLRRTLDDVDGHVGRLGGSFGKFAGIAAGALGGIAVGGFFKDAISGASDLNETISKVNTIFGSAADAAMVYGQDLAKAQDAAKDAQAKYQEAVEKSEDKLTEVRRQGQERAQDAALKISDAETNLADVTKDAADRVKDAKESAAEVAENVADRIKEAEESAAERVEGAQERQKEAHERAAEKREEVAQRVIDAEKALSDAQASGASAETIERLSDRVNKARENQAKTAERTAKDEAKADKDAADAAEDAREAVEKAKKDGAKAVEDAGERVAKAEESARDAVEDAEKRVAKARADAAEVHADTALAEDKVRESLAKSREEANKAQADVARIEREIAESRAAVAKGGAAANTQWGKEIDAFAKAAAKNYGISRQSALDASATFAVFGKAAGLQKKDLVGFSTTLTGLAADLGSFHNTKPEEAIEALGAALRGESEPIRRYGVMLDDATLKARAMEMGIYDGNGALTQQQKTMAAYQEILAQTKDAQGDFAKTSGGLAGQQKILAAQMTDLKTNIGAGLLPAMQGITTTAAEVITAFQEGGLGGAFAKIGEIIREAWPKVKAAAEEMLTKLGSWIKESGPDLLRKLGEWTGKFLEWVGNLTVDLLGKLGELMVDVFKWIADNREPILRKLGEWTSKFLEWAGSVAGPLLSKLGELLGSVLTWVSDHREEIFQKLGEWTGKFIDWAFDMAGKLLKVLVEDVIPAVLKWIADNGPTILLELAKWAGSFLKFAADLAIDLVAKLGTEVLPALLKWIADVAPDILLKLAEWTGKFLVWVASDLVPKLVVKLGEVLVALLKWIVDVAPEVLGKLAEWTAQFVGWVPKVAAALVEKAADLIAAFVGWIGASAPQILTKLADWGAQFVSWIAGVPGAMASGMATLIGWFGDQAQKLPGQLAHWTGEFAKWLGGLAGNITGAITDFAVSIAEAIWNWIKDKLPGSSGGVGGAGKGLTQNGQPMRLENGQWVYDGGPLDGQPVPPNQLSSQAQQAANPGQVPPPGPNQIFDPIRGWINGIAQAAGGDHDEENDGDLSPSGPGEANLTSNAIKLRREIQSTFRGFSSIGGYAYRTTAAGTPSDHATGKALDIMLPGLHNPLGDQIASWAVRQPEMKYVIWDNQIYSSKNPSWRSYAQSGKVGKANQGSPTGRHEDHVHISVLGEGGIVKARPGGTLALLGEAGQDEAVIPLHGSRGSGLGNIYVTVNVSGPVVGRNAMRELGMEVRDVLLDAKRQGVTIGLA